MAFNKKTWVDRVVEYPLRRLLTIVRPDEGSGTMVTDIQREEGEITAQGDAFSATNMNDLEGRIKDAFDEQNVDSLMTTVAKNGAHNLLGPVTATTTTTNGLTFTVNSDGSVTVSGTASAVTTFDLMSSMSLPAGSYVLTGCPSGGSSNSYRIFASSSLAGGSAKYEYGEGVSFTTSTETTGTVSIKISSGTAMGNPGKTFYPMLRLVSDENTQYTPYAKTNLELTTAISHVGMIIHSTTLDTEAKVKAIYGVGTSWIQHSGYVLRGATSGVVANSATKTGGNDNAIVPYHRHGFKVAGGYVSWTRVNYSPSSGFAAGSYGFAGADANYTQYTDYEGTSGNATNANIPNYKSVYIWERTA